MENNKDEMVANFQACTGVDDLPIALECLEKTNWDLTRAINEFFPDESARANDDNDIEMIQEIRSSNVARPSETEALQVDDSEDEDLVVVGASGPVSAPPKASNWRRSDYPSSSGAEPYVPIFNLYDIVIRYKHETYHIFVDVDGTVGDLKKSIQETVKLPICRQALTGWEISPANDATKVRTLNFCTRTVLNLTDITPDGIDDRDVAKLSQNFILEITDESSGKTYSLPYVGTTTITEVKIHMSQLSNIPVRHQQWSGWPSTISSDSEMLGIAGLDLPKHALSVRKKVVVEPKKSNKPQIADSDDSSLDEFEDAAENFNDEDMFLNDPVSRKLRPLIPSKVEDEIVGCLQFADEFACRYGPIHPEFFPGSLEDVIKEACMRPAKERKLLALYLHHDRSVLSNVFCTQLLCSDAVIQILAAYFVLWGWDLTYPDNQQRFMNSFTSGLGSMAAVQIKSIPVERLPAIVIINRVRSNTEIMAVIQGNVGIDELTASLSETVDVFQTQQRIEIKEEEERSARETIKQQQDAAFQESLEMDRAKEEARKYQELAEHRERQREEEERQKEAARIEAEKLSAGSRLPDEPADTETNITKIRVRIPQGQFLERRFRETDTLKVLLDWLVVQGYRQSDVKLLSSWPRRDLTSLDPAQTLKQLNLCPQETVILEER